MIISDKFAGNGRPRTHGRLRRIPATYLKKEK
jgi:hypothetical protein